MRRRTGSSLSTTPFCAQPLLRSNRDQHVPPLRSSTMSKVRLRQVFVGSSFSIAIILVAIAAESQQLLRSEDPSPNEANDFSPYVGKDGSISLPKDYRQTFEHMGTWAVAKAKDKPVSEQHIVYARHDDIEAYRRDAKFRDGTVLIKEITNVNSAE